MPMVRLVLFDAFATLIKPRRPIAEQYTEVFKPFFDVDPNLVKSSFKSALQRLQKDNIAYVHHDGVAGWWGEVIRATAIGAGGNPHRKVDHALPQIVPLLMRRFASREGYELYDDVLETLNDLKDQNVRVGVVSNSDARVRAVLKDLALVPMLDLCIVSEEEGVEKPDKVIWERAIKKSGTVAIKHSEVLHVGDELFSDYKGAENAGLQAMLIRRPGALGTEERREVDEDLTGIQVINTLTAILEKMR